MVSIRRIGRHSIWVDLYQDLETRAFAEPKLTGASAYDWSAKWRKYHEEASVRAGEEFFSQDGFCDVQELLALIEKDQEGKARKDEEIDKDLTVRGIKAALAEPRVRDQLRRAAFQHPSEWDAGGGKKWERLKALLGTWPMVSSTTT